MRCARHVDTTLRARGMSRWPSVKARQVLAALKRIGWEEVRSVGSHRALRRKGWEPYTFAFHDSREIGPKMMAKIGRETGLTPEDL